MTLKETSGNRFAVAFTKGASTLHEQRNPLSLQIKNASGGEDTYQGPDTSWAATNAQVIATGSLTTVAGSRFDYTDTYSAQDCGCRNSIHTGRRDGYWTSSWTPTSCTSPPPGRYRLHGLVRDHASAVHAASTYPG
ncbi:hypothetical protein ABZ912_57435 [Nonomuraea angiospora]|uniref:hypothetical protein n=1 Tax=Nonomuraea angiospora TaxID=46172 RepID=UPI00340D21B9